MSPGAEVPRGGCPGPDRLWIADLTAIPASAEPLYLAVVLDRRTRRSLGYALGAEPRSELVLAAVRMAAVAQPARSMAPDRGRGEGEAELVLGRRCLLNGIAALPGVRASSADAEIAESFFAMLGRDLLDARCWPRSVEAATAIVEWIEDYHNAQFAPGSTRGWIAAQLGALSPSPPLDIHGEESRGRPAAGVLLASCFALVPLAFWVAVVFLARVVL